MSLSLKDELRLKAIHQELNNSLDSLGILLKLLEEYVELRPEELSPINTHVNNLINRALSNKDKVLSSVTNSVQFLLSMESENMNYEKTKVNSGVIARSFIGAIVAIYPEGCFKYHSIIESKFFANYVKDLKNWQGRDRIGFDKWLNGTCEFPDYVTGLVNQETKELG